MISNQQITWEQADDASREILQQTRQQSDSVSHFEMACSMFSLPVRSSEYEVIQELNALRLCWNCLIRDLLRSYDAPEAAYDLCEVITEFYHHMCSIDQYGDILNSVLTYCDQASGAALVIENPLSRTGFAGLIRRENEDHLGADDLQLAVIPVPSDMRQFLDATEWDQVPRTDISHFDIPDYPAKKTTYRSMKDSLGTLDLWIWIHPDRVDKTVQQKLDQLAVLVRGGILSMTAPRGLRLKSRSSHSLHDRTMQRVNEATRSVLTLHRYVPEAGSTEDRERKPVEQLLRDIRGFTLAREVAAYNIETDEDGEIHSRVIARYPEGDHPISTGLGSATLKALLSRPRLHELTDRASRVVFPVLANGHTLCLIELVFGSEEEMARMLPSVAAFAPRLGVSLFMQRLLSLIEVLMDLMSDGPHRGNEIAEHLARLLGQSACSAWAFDRTTDRLILQQRWGLFLPQFGSTTLDAASGSLIREAIEHGEYLHLDIAHTELSVRHRDQLLASGMKQAIVVPIVEEEIGVVLLLWSRAGYRSDFFSTDDIAIIRFVASWLFTAFRLGTQAARHDRSIDRIMASLGHELMAPLSSIAGHLETIPSMRGDDRKIMNDVKAILNYAASYVDTLFSFAQLQTSSRNEPETKRPEKTRERFFEGIVFKVRTALEMQMAAKDLEMTCHFDPKAFPPYIAVTQLEEQYLYSIIFNLCANAVKYSERNGKSRVIRVVGARSTNWIRVSIENDGIGVPEGEDELIFRRSIRGSNATTASATGSGFGLFIARQLALQLGGKLYLAKTSSPTVFMLELPTEFAVWSE